MGRIIIVPGLDNSGPDHWQTWLQAQLPQARRIEQAQWQEPDLPGWMAAIRATLDLRDPAILVAHSFGCLASIRIIEQHRAAVRAALLVAPADPEKFGFEAERFLQPLGVRALLVASEDDPWMSLGRARTLAAGLGADFLNLGRAGHINARSGYGVWPGGLKLVEGFTRPPVRSFRQAGVRAEGAALAR